MTFFHEIGHSMNANHDDKDEFKDRKEECNPSDDRGGSYLMFSTGTEGLLPNNRVYSHCSLDTISSVDSLSLDPSRLPSLRLESTPNISVEWNRNVSRPRSQRNITAMGSSPPMRSVMNTACRVPAAPQIVNWNQVHSVHPYVSLLSRSPLSS